jgi:hypothetical protein
MITNKNIEKHKILIVTLKIFCIFAEQKMDESVSFES